jgi:hypothetical protein
LTSQPETLGENTKNAGQPVWPVKHTYECKEIKGTKTENTKVLHIFYSFYTQAKITFPWVLEKITGHQLDPANQL